MKVIFVNDSKQKRKYGDIKLNSGDAVVEVNGIRKWMKKGTFQTEVIEKDEIIIDKVDTVETVIDEPATDEGTKVDEVEPQPEVVEEIVEDIDDDDDVEDEPVEEPIVEEKKPIKKSKKKTKK